MGLKVVSVNIEGNKHLDKVRAFLERERPDVVCLQEVRGEDILQLAGETYNYHEFAPNDVLGNILRLEGNDPVGIAVLSRQPLITTEKIYLGGGPRVTVVPPKYESHPPVLLKFQVGELVLGTIHFTWTPDGNVSDEQCRDLQQLLKTLSGVELVLCGDFNISRGNELYKILAGQWRDNVPTEVESTLDPVLHYANKGESGKLKLVVDYVWSTPKYMVSEVRIESGVSDHCAIVANVEKFDLV